MASNPITSDELERAITGLNLPFGKAGPDIYEVTCPDGHKANVSLENGQIDCPRSKDLRAKIMGRIADMRAGLEPAPLLPSETTKIMALMQQVPGYMPEIDLKMIANLVHCPDATAEDLIMLAVTAKNIGANPFLPGEIFLIKPKQRDDGSQPSAYTVVGQTLVAKKLSSVPGFLKSTRGVIVESKEGVPRCASGNYYNPKREELTGAWCEIQYENGEVKRKEMPLHEIMGTSPQWKKSPGLMAAKTVFMMAAREAEPNLLGNCYDVDEMDGRIKMDESKEIKASG
jgi:hypothetical protein